MYFHPVPLFRTLPPNQLHLVHARLPLLLVQPEVYSSIRSQWWHGWKTQGHRTERADETHVVVGANQTCFGVFPISECSPPSQPYLLSTQTKKEGCYSSENVRPLLYLGV